MTQMVLSGSSALNPGHLATFSQDRLYRYTLQRTWSDAPPAVFIGLNPSTADEQVDDPTIRRCSRFARDWGCGGLVMLNLYAWRATDPKGLLVPADPVGPGNDSAIRALAGTAELVVAAWGAWPGPDRGRAAMVAALVGELQVLGLTKDLQPRHPLYMRADSELRPWRPS